MNDDPVLIWGAGAIGGTIGAHLVQAGHHVVFVDRAREHVEVMRHGGLTITGPLADFNVAVEAMTPDAVEGRSRLVLLCVKAQDTPAAARALTPHLASNGVVISVQNGLNELTIAEIVGEPRTLGCFVNFGADYVNPGEIHYGGRGAVVVGEIDSTVTPRVEALHRLLLEFDDRAVLTRNIWGYLWSKLAYGALLFATALTNASIADCLASKAHQGLFLKLAREVLAVAEAKGIKPEAFDGFDPESFCPGASETAGIRSLDALVAFNRRSAKTHSGIWRDLAVRKRKTEVDAQLGPIVRIAADLGLSAPLISRLILLIHDVEKGRMAQSWLTLEKLREALPA
jgi:2-dehydropantoate 2-reductase